MEHIVAKKPKYIRKYDFIAFFNRNEDEWFYKSNDLSKLIDEKLKITLKSNNSVEIDDEEDDLNEDYEFDSYEYFKELEDRKKSDESDDPKVIEGNKIDKLSRSFIREAYKNIYNVVDFDDFNLSNEDAANKTLEIMKMNDHDFIMFQPCFIYKGKAITKPDAFIRNDNKYILIETKGTTSAKMIHLVDIIFQSHVISHVLKTEMNAEIFEYKLCLVAYEKAKKNKITFILTDCVPISKSGWTESEKEKSNFNQKYSSDHIKFKQNIKIGTNVEYTINDLINKKVEPTTKKKNTIEKYHTYIDDILKESTFEKIVNRMLDHQIVTDLSFEPMLQYKDWIKTVDYWNNLKEYYFYNPIFFKNSYSGYVITYKEALNSQANDVNRFFAELNTQASGRKAFANYYRALQSNQINIYETAKSEFRKLKRKRIYFDFESLNLATRVIDNTVPFIQTVNQVSVIIDYGDGNIENASKQNIVIDPLDVSIESLEQIIDAIYPKSDAKNYSYVVYNKSFEKSRLTEMAEIINSQEYYDKVKVINENIYDLADFFDPRKDWSIILPQLHGFYSIKKVLPEIRKMRPDLFEKSGSVDYQKDLSIHNGSEAQALSTKRFFGKITNDEWKQIEINLKKYCENDVRAMVAITYWLENILK